MTSAHEFHHASQFAYDWLEDYWLMEGTATNMEETVYPAIDDNVFFLDLWSPLTRPGSPSTAAGSATPSTARGSSGASSRRRSPGDPSIVREIWERADASVPDVSPDDYSLQAVTRELTQRGLASSATSSREFAVANRLGDYDDAETADYPVPPRTATFGVGRQNPVVGWRSWEIDHLAARYLSFSPGGSATPTSKLRVEVRLPKYGARATVVVVRADGTVTARRLNQGPAGYAS